jgi:hypothetical protein
MDTMSASAECRRESIASDPLVEQIFPKAESLWDRPLPVAGPGTSTSLPSLARRSGRGGHVRPHGSLHSGHPGGDPARW